MLLAVAAAVMVPPMAGAEVPEAPTFHKDIEPILQRSCQICHRPNNMAPMSLMSYQETRPWARSIKNKVEVREMPPWHIDPKVGLQGFKNDRSLSNDEIATIARWVDSGAPRGNPEDAPAPVELQEFGAWTIDPDVIVTSPLQTVPQESGDWWGDYIVPSGITSDRYIQAIQIKAGDLRVVHHALTYAVTDPDSPLNDSSSDAFLNDYAVGKNADVYPAGTGRKIAADSRVRFSFHCHSVGEEVTEQTELGMVLYPEGYEPDHILYSRQLGRVRDLDIPAGQVTRHDGYTKMYLPGKLTAFQSHMHFFGTRQCLELIYPTGATEMINCANFDFNWHVVYNHLPQALPELDEGDDGRPRRRRDPTLVPPDDAPVIPDNIPQYEKPTPTRNHMSMLWVVYRGPSHAEFEPAGYQEWAEGMDGDGWTSGTFETSVTFNEPGTYTLRAFASDAMLISHANVIVTVTQ